MAKIKSEKVKKRKAGDDELEVVESSKKAKVGKEKKSAKGTDDKSKSKKDSKLTEGEVKKKKSSKKSDGEGKKEKTSKKSGKESGEKAGKKDKVTKEKASEKKSKKKDREGEVAEEKGTGEKSKKSRKTEKESKTKVAKEKGKSEKSKKSSKKKDQEAANDSDASIDHGNQSSNKASEDHLHEANGQSSSGEAASQVKAAPNPNQYTRVFLGNLAYSIDEATLTDFLKSCGPPQNIHWLSDKETGRFYGTGFVEFGDAIAAARAVAMNGQVLLERPIKIEFTESRANQGGAGGAGNKQGANQKSAGDYGPRSERPDGCQTLFLANLSYSITEDAVYEFFQACGEITNVRWLEDRNTGEFKGCGWVEFASPGSIDQAVAMAGQPLMGRPVRVDYA